MKTETSIRPSYPTVIISCIKADNKRSISDTASVIANRYTKLTASMNPIYYEIPQPQQSFTNPNTSTIYMMVRAENVQRTNVCFRVLIACQRSYRLFLFASSIPVQSRTHTPEGITLQCRPMKDSQPSRLLSIV